MEWQVLIHPDCVQELRDLPRPVRRELGARLRVVERFGPQTGRPTVDTLKGSDYPNMKEVRFDCEGQVWRFAFAFDPLRRAVVLCGGAKGGMNEDLFYRQLIATADKRFKAHLDQLPEEHG